MRPLSQRRTFLCWLTGGRRCPRGERLHAGIGRRAAVSDTQLPKIRIGCLRKSLTGAGT